MQIAMCVCHIIKAEMQTVLNAKGVIEHFSSF